MPADIVKEDLIQQQILQAAKRLFQVHGLYKVTVDDVAKAVGKGRSSLYYYYKSKDEIFEAVMDIEISEMIAAITRAVDEAPGIEQKINAFCTTKLNVLREKRGFFSVLDAGMDADAMSHFNQTRVTHHNLIIKREGILLNRILAEAIENNELRPINEADMEMVVFVLLSSIHGLKREMITLNNWEDIGRAVNALTRMVLYGLKK